MESNPIEAIGKRHYAIIIVILFVLLLLALIGWSRAPKNLTVYYPPDLGLGSEQPYLQIPKPTVYTFAFYVFQQLNHWPQNAAVDAPEQIKSLKAFLTPDCYRKQLRRYEESMKQKALEDRVRHVREIPGRGYAPQRVIREARGVWTVGLDLHLREESRRVRIKDRVLHYPLRVVRAPLRGLHANPVGLALDCFAAKPYELGLTDSAKEG